MGTRSRSAVSAFVVVLLLLSVSTARASTPTGLVTFVFTGQVTSFYGTPFGIATSVGQPVAGTITYDTSAPAPGIEGVAGYMQGEPSGMSVVISGVTLESHSSSLQVLNNAYGVDNVNGYYMLPGWVGSIMFCLTDFTQTALSSLALPASLDVASFSYRVGSVSDLVDWQSYVSFSIDTVDTVGPPPLPVTIDVKPGSVENSINPASEGVVPVAILTTDNFDVATVDGSSVRFGITGREAAPTQWALEDVNGDARADAILHFDAQATGIACGDTSVTVTGALLSGEAIEGTDSINTVGCKE